MEKLDQNFSREKIADLIQVQFEPVFNVTLTQTFNAFLSFTEDSVYIIPRFADDEHYGSRFFNVSEIDTYGKKGLFGFRITLKDGEKLTFANVGKKMRLGIIEAIEARKA